jgi:hypothetical protein
MLLNKVGLLFNTRLYYGLQPHTFSSTRFVLISQRCRSDCYDDRPMHTYTYILEVQATTRNVRQRRHLKLEVLLFRGFPVLLMLPLPLARILQYQEKM